MEKNRKDLKTLSILVLALVGLTLVRAIVSACVNGIPQAQATQGISQEMVKIMSIIAFALSFVLLLPQIYVGVKGLKIADGAPSSKAPVVWAIILAVLAAISTISAISNMLKVFNFDTILAVFDSALDVAVYICYCLCIRKIALDK